MGSALASQSSWTCGRFYSGVAGWSDSVAPATKARRAVSGRFYSGAGLLLRSASESGGEQTGGPIGFNLAEATTSLGINSALGASGKKPPSTRASSANDGPIGANYGSIPSLFAQNRSWSERVHKDQPDFFDCLSKQQSPKYLWIGCSDSRVPANEVVDLRPGELFVHRNVANVVVHTDLNCLSVLQYAVEALRVEHVIVCGHYGCGGVKAALNGSRLGLIDNWLRHIVDVKEKHKWAIEACPYPEQLDLLCELNVIEQAGNICDTTIVQDAWTRGQSLQIHSWIYGLEDGLLKDLGLHVSSKREIAGAYENVLKRYNADRSR